jgi:hypothetical protein
MRTTCIENEVKTRSSLFHTNVYNQCFDSQTTRLLQVPALIYFTQKQYAYNAILHQGGTEVRIIKLFTYFFYTSIQRDLDDEVSKITCTAGSFICRVQRMSWAEAASVALTAVGTDGASVGNCWGLLTNLGGNSCLICSDFYCPRKKKKEMSSSAGLQCLLE